jgi:hypothetical protein
MPQFLIEEFDKFKNERSIRHKDLLDIGIYQICLYQKDIGGIKTTFIFAYRHNANNPGELGDYVFLLDDKNSVKLEPISNACENEGNRFFLSAAYKIESEQLKSICDANKIECKLYGCVNVFHKGGKEQEHRLEPHHISYFQQFYNETLDPNAYPSSVTNPAVTPPLKSIEEQLNEVDEIRKQAKDFLASKGIASEPQNDDEIDKSADAMLESLGYVKNQVQDGIPSKKVNWFSLLRKVVDGVSLALIGMFLADKMKRK